MRKNIVAGNWKMNKTLQEGIALAKEDVYKRQISLKKWATYSTRFIQRTFLSN